MNKEIEELWLQAHLDNGVTPVTHSEKVIERFVDLIVDKCADTVIESDPSEQMILHEPYRTVMDNVLRTFDDDDDS